MVLVADAGASPPAAAALTGIWLIVDHVGTKGRKILAAQIDVRDAAGQQRRILARDSRTDSRRKGYLKI